MLERKVAIILLGYMIGIIMELYFKKSIVLFIFILLFLIFIIKYIKLSRKSILKEKRFKVIKKIARLIKVILKPKIICIFIVSFIIGILYTEYLNNRYDNLYSSLEERDFIGVVQSEPEEKEYITKYKIKIQKIKGDSKYKNTNLYLIVNNNLEKLEYGDLIHFEGEYIAPEVQKNYRGFDYKEYLKTMKIYGTVKCTVTKIDILEKNKANIISLKMNELAKNIKQNIYKLCKKTEANLLIGILIGDTKEIDEEIENNFRDSSLIHILAVSGTHINYIILSLLYINNKTNLNKKIGKSVTIIVLILFMFLVGFSASVVRAVIMGITIIVSKLLYKKLDIINSISFSALILLIINPFTIENVGFLLSYGGTIGIVSLSSNIKKIRIKGNKENSLTIEKKQYKYKLINNIKEILSLTLSAQIIIMPILARMFNTVSLTFFLSNLIASPIMGVVTILGFSTIFVSFISISIAKVLAIPLTIMLKLLIAIANFFGSMKISKIYITTISMMFIVFYYIFVFLVNYIMYFKKSNVGATCGRTFLRSISKEILNVLKKNYKKLLICFIIIIIIFNLFSSLSRSFKIHFIDVGQR